jgi:hypothetical protein
LSLGPFLAADGVLLFAASFIAWRAPGELADGSLLGVVVCTCLGAVLTVLPFVFNDAREREAALAERQRELADLVTSSTATASRWGAQWAAAATGLEDAAGLASRNIAAAERLPAVFQEKIDAFARRLDQAEAGAQAREERAAEQEASLVSRAGQSAVIASGLEQTLAGFARMETDLRERHTALAAALAAIPAAVASAQVAREGLEERFAAAPAQIEAHVQRLTTEAELRLAATTDALASRLAGLDATLGLFAEQLERVKHPECFVAPSITENASGPDPVVMVPVADSGEGKADSEAPVIAAREETVLAVSVQPSLEEQPPASIRKETIMDPFYIPSDGYSALAEAMDAGRV